MLMEFTNLSILLVLLEGNILALCKQRCIPSEPIWPCGLVKDVEARKVWVFSENGRTVVNLNNNKLVVQAQRPSKWSMAEDGQVFQKRERGAFGLEEYECTHPARLYGKKLSHLTWGCIL